MTKKKSFEYSFDLTQPAYGQSPEQILQNATRLHQQGNLAIAEKLYQQVLKVQPKHAYTLNLLGALYSQKGDHRAGEKLIKKAIAIDSSIPDYHSNLALALQYQGKMAEARDAFSKATRLNPGFIPAWLGLGNTSVNLADLDRAIEAFRTVLNIQPDYFPAYNNLGNAYREKRMFAEAHNMFSKLIELRPDLAEGWFNLGLLYKQEENGEQAVAAFNKAIELKPDYQEAKENRAWCRLNLLNDLEGAMQDFEFMSKANPDYVIPYYICKSSLYLQQDNLDEAEAMLNRALELNKLPADTHQREKAGKPGLLSTTTKLEPRVRWQEGTIRSLGHIAHLRKDYDRAFSCYSEANAIMARQVVYDRDAHEKMIDTVISVFTPGFIAEFSGFGTDIELPVIITGMPRSGKTLTEQIIARHPGVAAAGEVAYFTRLTPRMTYLFESDQAWPFCCKSLNRKIADTLIGEYLGTLRSYGDKAHLVTDTSPGNYLHLGLISLLFPKAPIIHSRRHPVDMSLDIYFKGFRNYKVHSYSNHLLDIAHYYLQLLRLMEHWHKVLPAPIMESRYEDLVTDPAGQGRKLLEFCGLEYADSRVTEQLVSGDVTWDRYRRGQQAVNRSFMDLRNQYAKHTGPLQEVFVDAR